MCVCIVWCVICASYSGELKTAVELDRETTSHYTLVAAATDGGGLSCSAQVSLTLLDVNDNAPQFGQSELTASVYENTPTKSLITRIQAMDPDLGKTHTHTHTHRSVVVYSQSL